MKFTVSIAVLALLNSANAIKLRDEDDLFTDAGEETETLASLNAAEKIHGSKFSGISKEEQTNLLNSRSEMTFADDEFVKNSERKLFLTGAQNLVQITDQHYPEARPIGEVMAMIGMENTDDILSGAQLNDDDDTNETLQSLESAEKTMGVKMGSPEVYHKVATIRQNGAIVENLLASNNRISSEMIELGATPKDEEKPKDVPKAVQAVQQKKQEVTVQKKQENAAQNAFDMSAAHFHEDDELDSLYNH